jgi:hypothetical protein
MTNNEFYFFNYRYLTQNYRKSLKHGTVVYE